MDQAQPEPVRNLPNTPSIPPSRPRRRSLSWLLTGLVVLGGAAAAGYWFFFHNTLPPNPQLTFPTPFLNVRPNVAYVGDGSCVDCHDKETKHFSNHPMGRALAPMADLADAQNLDRSSHNPFDFKDFRYEVIKRGNSIWHKETRLSPDKKMVYEKEMEVTHVLGSGAHGHTFLHFVAGRLWESPISWYTEKARWDLSPGYHSHNSHFNRPVAAQCLSCHSNHVDPIKGTVNAFRPPLFSRGHAIGCERCHGPGELHVARRMGDPAGVGNSPDYTIVNPKHLEPSLREAVCQQCHLQGEQRVNRLGRDPTEFRPGLPLHFFQAIFVNRAELIDSRKAVGQVEQMRLSACFQMSEGKLGCISCHDSHRSPTQTTKAGYYRERCLQCHKPLDCSLVEQKRQLKADNCVSCHMPANSSSNIVHASITDHRILKDPKNEPANKSLGVSNDFPLVLFHQDLEDPTAATRDRDLGIVMARMSVEANNLQFASQAHGHLKKSLKLFPDDLEAGTQMASVLWLLKERKSAYQLIRQLTRQHPNHELTLSMASFFARSLYLQNDALDFNRRLVELNPDDFDAQVNLAELLRIQEQWAPALAAAQKAIKLNPERSEPRQIAIFCHLRLGQKDQARVALETYLLFQPPNADLVKRWFD